MSRRGNLNSLVAKFYWDEHGSQAREIEVVRLQGEVRGDGFFKACGASSSDLNLPPGSLDFSSPRPVLLSVDLL